VGRVIDVSLSTAAFPLDSSPGPPPGDLRLVGVRLRGAGRGGTQRGRVPPAATTRFVISSLVAEGDRLAEALAGEIGHRQEVSLVDAAGLAAGDGSGTPRATWWCSGWTRRARAACRACAGCCARARAAACTCCPGGGACAGSARRPGGSAGREDVAGLLFLNCPQSDVALMLGRPVDWHPRPNRALLHDRHADRTVTVVPFVQAEGDEL
jgi:hypothetical protein